MDTSRGHRERNCIVIIDDDSINRETLREIFAKYYECEEAENGLEGLRVIEQNEERICAVLLDVSMPVMDGFELLRIMNSRGTIQKIPFFLITVSTEYEVARTGYELGVMDVVTKPVNPFIILRRVQNIIELFRTRENLRETVFGQAEKIKENVIKLDTLHRNTIETLASAIEFRDVDSGEHTNRIYSVTKCILSNTEFGEGLSEEEIENIAIASIMHDIGKIAISDIILNKPGKLTKDEFELMKTHTVKGAMLMKQISQKQEHESYRYAYDIACHHHERWDGKGYPEGLKGDEISICAQVVSIADVYDALLSPRVYKKAYSPDEAVRMITNGECGTFNPKLVKSFLEVEPQMRKWYVYNEEEPEVDATFPQRINESTVKQEERKAELATSQEVVNVLLLMTAIQAVFDMIFCVNLTQNTYHMIDDERFLTHMAGHEGKFDDLIRIGAQSVPETHRQTFIDTFCRESLLKAYQNGKKSVLLEHPQMADDGMEHKVETQVLFVEEPQSGDILEITLARYIDNEWEEKEKTKQILSDALLVAQQANSAKSDFLSRMSHDIRTPLNAIIGMTTIMKANINKEEKLKECIAKIGISSKYLLALINDILDFSKIESGSLSVNEMDFDIRNMVGEIKTIIGERALEKNQKFEVSVGEDVGGFYKGDEVRIRQILINLLDNAYKYTPEGGTYSLRIHLNKSTKTHHFLLFEIEDDGMGISEQYMEQIFNPFVQGENCAAKDGVGLGLSIARNLVYLMNGTLDVKSEVGKGTKFIVELPLENRADIEAAKEIKQPNTMEVKTPISYNGEKILVAEDNELNQEIVKTILEMENLQVVLAADGKEAVELFEKSEVGEYLVIFMDLLMPVMNGYEATKCIRKSNHKEAQTIPIYALTANAFSSDVAEAKKNGMNGHIAKPIDFEVVSKVLQEILAKKVQKEEAKKLGE